MSLYPEIDDLERDNKRLQARLDGAILIVWILTWIVIIMLFFFLCVLVPLMKW